MSQRYHLHKHIITLFKIIYCMFLLTSKLVQIVFGIWKNLFM